MNRAEYIKDLENMLTDLHEQYKSTKETKNAINMGTSCQDDMASISKALDITIEYSNMLRLYVKEKLKEMEERIADIGEVMEKEDLHESLKVELNSIGIPETYVIYEILDNFITLFEYGNCSIKSLDDEETGKVPDEIYSMLSGIGRNAGYAKRAITMLTKIDDLSKSKKFGFDKPSSRDSNNMLLINMYQYMKRNRL